MIREKHQSSRLPGRAVSLLFTTESHYPVRRAKILDAIEKHLLHEVKRKCEVSISIVGNRRMRMLNHQYRHLDKTTDVLSFPQYDTLDDKGPFVDAPDNVLRLGDIVVSYPEAVAEAMAENKLVDDKVIELVLHGLDHLLGKHHPE